MRPPAMALLSLVFFLSGMSALIFETLWFRQAGLTFGGSVAASALVLSSFMAGLAIGNGLAARLGHRIGRPIRFYAALEIVIGVAGLGLVLLLPSSQVLVTRVLRPLLDSFWLLQPARFAVAFLLLLGPAVAMGATLPVLVKAFTRDGGDFGRKLGWLYGINTLGAVAGAISSEIVWIPVAGVIGSGCIAAGFNGVAAVLALVAARFAEASAAGPPPAVARTQVGFAAARLLVAAFVSGFTLLALEVVWFRMLVLFVPQTSVVFGCMLAMVLAGIGLGGLLASLLLRLRADFDQFVAVVALLSGVATVLTYGLYPLATLRLANPNTPLSLFPLSAALMFPTSVLSGLLFTCLGKRLHAELGSDVRSAGLITLANTAGSMLGPLAASFLMLPRLGVEQTLWLLGLSYGAVALCAFPPLGSLARRTVHAAALVSFGLAILLFPKGVMRGVYLWFLGHTSAEYGSEELVALREGVNATIGYTRATFLGETYYHRLITDSINMSGTRIDAQRYMSLFAHLPYAFHAKPRDALLISYGVGITASALLAEPDLESLDVVDISADILTLSSRVVTPDHPPLRDPRARAYIEDGRYFMQSRDRRYDIITGEPPPPAAAGVVNLYTREYFELMRSRLRPGGIASYWLPVWQLTEDDSKAIVGAFCAAFPDCTLWEGTSIDWILLGTRDAWGPLEESVVQRPWRQPSRREQLAAIGLEAPEQLAALFLAGAEFLTDWIGDVPPLVDNWPDRAPRWNPAPWTGSVPPPHYARIMNAIDAERRFSRSTFVAKMWQGGLRERSLAFFPIARIAREHQLRPNERLRLRELHRLLTGTQLKTLPLWLLHSDADMQRIVWSARADDPRLQGTVAYHRAAAALAHRDYAAAAPLLDAVRTHEFPQARYLALYALAMQGDLDRVRARASSPGWPRDDGVGGRYWSFMRETFGVDRPELPAM